ncbi:MAG: hypothetical protein V3T65_00280 [Acidobacteriota bacterium]
MKSFITGVLFWCMVVMVLACQAVAQEQAGEAEKAPIDPNITTRVTLGSSSGTPGTSLVVPIYFTPGRELQVGRLKLDVNFVSTNLKFSKLDPGIAAELGNVDISTEVQVGKNEKGLETTTLSITASFPSGEPSEKGIPAGLLGYLTLRIEEDGRPASITLRTSAEGSFLGSNEPLADLRSFDATVDVLAPGTQPIVACFFFTH